MPANAKKRPRGESLTEFNKRLEEASPGLDEKSRCILEGMYDSGELLEGVADFGGGSVKGVGNGMFYAILRVSNAPAEGDGGRRGANRLFWCKGDARKDRTSEVFRACTSAGFPLIFESDAPDASVMGAVAGEALLQGYTGLGKTGRDTAMLVQKLSSDFVDEWKSGSAKEDCLVGSWAIQNAEDDILVDKANPHNLWSMRSHKAIKILQRTRMSKMCSSSGQGRMGRKGGEQTSTIKIGEERWGGSEVTMWAMSKDIITLPHFDTHTVSGTTFFAAAAGNMRPVRRDHVGPAERAIVVCAQDRVKVAKLLRLDLHEIPAHQYRGKMDLIGLAKILTENKIRFVVMDFPVNCSYILPIGCAHMFKTYGLVESSGWLPSLTALKENFDHWSVFIPRA